MSAEPDEAREFAEAYRRFLAWVHEEESRGGTAEVVALVGDRLPPEGQARSVVTREFPTFEQVNVQVALDAWMAEPERRVEIHGLTMPPHYGPVGMQQLLHGDALLPEAVLRRVERHTLDIGRHRAALRDAGQHLKRGLLLYGPPGAGKTHTTRYVVQQLAGTTVLLLSGQSLHFIGMVTTLARELQPSAVVLEDVDLVAEDRGFGPGPSPVLFTLLDAMDGAAADADLLFLLTTNRADLLEPALAARPGRVDVAIEIGLPDVDARRRLFEVSSRSLPLVLDETEVDDVVERTAGVTASFVKELLRRAALEALADGDGSLDVVTAVHVSRALDDLLESGQAVTRALLGVQDGNVAEYTGTGRSDAGHRGVGWLRPSRVD